MVRRLPLLIAAALAVASPALGDSGVPPFVASPPELGLVAAVGDLFQFTATATGSPTPTVQWQWAPARGGPWSDIAGATSTTLTATSTNDPASPFTIGHAFRAVFTNSAGTALSRPEKLVSRTNWMRDLRSEVGDVPLTELTIPGSHDMGTYGISGDSSISSDGLASDVGCLIGHGVCESYATAQDHDKDATEELADGIRYFDLRVCLTDSGAFVTCHGLEAAPLQDILEQTRAFVDSHPGEVVLLDLNHHYFPGASGNAAAASEAALIEQTFALPNGGSLLIPPQYCTPGDPTTGTCAKSLTLNRIATEHLGSVIVNFENDGAPGECALSSNGICLAFRQPVWGVAFYDNHPLFWGRSADPPGILEALGECSLGASMPSCFANTPFAGLALTQSLDRLAARADVADAQHFFVQFLQTTPDLKFIALHLDGSLLDMARDSNPFVGPGVLRFDVTRPENLNILAINFYDITQYEQGSFDFVEEILRFDEEARVPPVIHVTSLFHPAATGWFNAAILASHANKLQVDFSARDYRFITGIEDFSCRDGFEGTNTSFGGILPPFDVVTANVQYTDGVHSFECTAEDGAKDGLEGHGSRGAGFGSDQMPVVFKVDTTPPEVHCVDTHLILNQPDATVTATVTDATSGPVATTLTAPAATGQVGTFFVSFTASDVAGNTATVSCPYTVGYDVELAYNATRLVPANSVFPVRVTVVDFFGRPVTNLVLTATAVENTLTHTTTAPTSPGQPTTLFHGVGSDYLYRLKTAGLTAAPYTLLFSIAGDPGTHEAPFEIR
jgi:hypothetical protein